MYRVTKKKVHGLLHPEIVGDKHWDKIINIFIIVLIILNVIAVILETVQALHDQYSDFFYYFDLISVIIFTIEYACLEQQPRRKIQAQFLGKAEVHVFCGCIN